LFGVLDMPGGKIKRVDGVKQEDAYKGNHPQPIEEIESGGLLVGMVGDRWAWLSFSLSLHV
jgi:hypothetical protein